MYKSDSIIHDLTQNIDHFLFTTNTFNSKFSFPSPNALKHIYSAMGYEKSQLFYRLVSSLLLNSKQYDTNWELIIITLFKYFSERMKDRSHCISRDVLTKQVADNQAYMSKHLTGKASNISNIMNVVKIEEKK